MKLLKNIFQLAIIVALTFSLYHYRDEINIRIRGGINYYLPCTLPITYSIGEFDSQFGIGREEFLADMAKAEKVWESVSEKELFRYIETGGVLTVNLIYDSRQETTNKLREIDGTITSKQSSYDTLRASYDRLQEGLADQKSRYATSTDALERTRRLYEREIEQWNRRGGAPEPDYSRLQQEKNAINARIGRLNNELRELNKATNELNTLAEKINTLAKDLHLDVDLFNTTRRTNGDEFSEGEYERDSRGERINIYEFGSDVKLIRVLTHELGHALGLDHVDDADAIMYRLNTGKNETPTQADTDELKMVCGMK
jgi:hypothetical protein